METPGSTAAKTNPNFDVSRKYVRVTGERNGFVEFDFAVGEPGVFVEMMLSPEAFQEFCRVNAVEMLPAGEQAGEEEPSEEDDAWNWRLSDATGQSDKKL